MQDEQNQQPEKDSGKKPGGNVSAFRNAWELEAKARREAEMKERQRQADAEEAAYQKREEYAKELAEEKVDLIRLKQGVISESDRIFRDEETEKHYTIWQKIGNWFYHSKWWLGIASFCVLLTAFLVYDYVTRANPDLRILLLSDHNELYVESANLCEWLESMCEDYTNDGEILVESVYIPVSKQAMENSGNYSASYNSQLLIQFQTNTCMLVLVDPEAEEYLQPEDMFTDLEKLYPDCPYADGWRLRLDDTDFGAHFGLSVPLHEGSCLCLRIPAENMNTLEENQEAYDRAKALLDQIVASLGASA